jgi:hypothetical protein
MADTGVIALGPETSISPEIEARIARVGHSLRWLAFLYSILLVIAHVAGWGLFLMPQRFSLGGKPTAAAIFTQIVLTAGVLLIGGWRRTASTKLLWRRAGVVLCAGAATAGVVLMVLSATGTLATAPADGLSVGVAALAVSSLGSVTRRPRVVVGAQVGALLVTGLSAILVLGYLSGDASFGRLFTEIEVSFHSASTMLLAGAGVLLMRPASGLLSAASSAGPGGAVLRRLGPVFLLGPALLMLLAESVAVTQRVETLALIAISSGFLLVALLGAAVYLIDRMRVETSTAVTEAERARVGLKQEAPVVANLSDLLHTVSIGEYQDWDVATAYRPAIGSVAGDSSIVVGLPNLSIGVVLVDVTGHGAEPSLIAVQVRDLLLHSLALGHTPGEALESVGWAKPDDLLASAIVVLLHPEEGEALVANAGHPPAIFTGTQESRLVGPTGPLLFLDGESTFENSAVRLELGESLTLFSDGIADVQVMRGDLGEVEVLADLLLAEGGDATRSAQLVMGFGSSEPTDDQTTVVLRRSG